MLNRRVLGGFIVVTLVLALAFSAVAVDIPLRNWSAPPTWTPQASSGGGRTALAVVAGPTVPFIPVAPCRVMDTRGNGQVGAFGTPTIGTGVTRAVPIPTHPTCTGIPTSSAAYSLNVAVTNTGSGAFGYLQLWPTGQAQPVSANLNYPGPGATLANAAVVQAGTSGSINVFSGNTSADVIIDINGYYGNTPGTTSSTFVINAGTSPAAQFHTTGGFSAVDAFCDTPNVSCSGYHSSAGAGNYSAVFNGGRGMSTTSSDAGYPAIRGDSSSASAGVFVSTSFGAGQTGGVVGIAGPIIDNSWGYAGVRGIGTNFGVLGISTLSGTGGFQMDGSGALNSGSYLGYSATDGLHTIGTTSATGVKSFVEPHPTDPTKVIRYVALEGGEAGTYFRGKGRFLKGRAVIAVPEDFRLVSDEEGLTVQITPIGGLANVAVLQANLNEIVAQSSRDVEFYYLVHGVRETFKDFRPAGDVNIYYMPESPASGIPGSYSAAQKKRLIDNGTYNPDGTVNVVTAERVGWTKIWQQRADGAIQDEQRAKR